MSVLKDPQKREWRHLRRCIDFTGRRVIEVGAGEGRLTWQYAREAATVAGVDPDADALRVARVDRPAELAPRVHLVRGSGVRLPFRHGAFDLALFAWSF